MHRRRDRWLFLLVLVVGIAGFCGVWYSSTRGSGSGTPEIGGDYVEGVAGKAQRINPLFAGYNDVDDSLVSLVFAGLTRLDNNGRPYPDLASNWTVSSDGLTYTFDLRPGLVWQDGKPLTASDVVFTYDMVRNPAVHTTSPLAQLLADAKVAAPNDNTVQITLTQPYSPLPAYLTLGILPQHLLTDVTPADLFDAPFNQQPVGAGPYRLEQLTDDEAVLAANTAYHFSAPFIPHIHLRFYTDEEGLLTALQAGDIDGALFTTGLSRDDRLRLEDSHHTLTELSSGQMTFVYLNLEQNEFQDAQVRRSLLAALDRNEIAGLVYGGLATAADSPIPAGIWSHKVAIQDTSADLTLATQLLDAAGLKPDVDGVRLRFDLAVDPDPVHITVANDIARQWQQIGVVATVKVMGNTELNRDELEPRSYQAALVTVDTGPAPDPYSMWHSSEIDAEGKNLAAVRDENLDKLLEQARETPSQGEREDLYRQFQSLFAQDLPSLPIYTQNELYVQKDSVHGVRAGYLPYPGARFWQVQEWYVETR